MALTRLDLIQRRKLKYYQAVIRHKARRKIELAMQKTMLNQLRAENAADRKRAA